MAREIEVPRWRAGSAESNGMPKSTTFTASRAQATEDKVRSCTIGALDPLHERIVIADYDPGWPALFAREAERIRSVLGRRALRIEHAGSTSVPGLAAKPIIDIVLAVADAAHEGAYARDLEVAGYLLRIREIDWHQHRMFKGPDTDINLHVFSDDCVEIDRMLLFRDTLRSNAQEREYYLRAKRLLAQQQWKYVQEYADAKTEVIEEIIARALAHRADSQPPRGAT